MNQDQEQALEDAFKCGELPPKASRWQTGGHWDMERPTLP